MQNRDYSTQGGDYIGLYEEELHREDKRGNIWGIDCMELHGTLWGRNYTKKELYREGFCGEELDRK